MRILGIETSCDETGIALLDSERGLLGQALHSQVEMHQAYGGVVPELASRDHIRRVLPLLDRVLQQTNGTAADIDAIAVTAGPGLAGALLVGTSIAHAIGYALDRPVVEVHHLEGHLLSPLLAKPAPPFPFVALLVSGGHTQLMRVDDWGRYTLLGETVDDAAGEAFDKTAQLLGLGYPGGPAVSRLADFGVEGSLRLPRPMLNSGNLDFSFSGLKTAVLTVVRRQSNLCEQGPCRYRARIRRCHRRCAGRQVAACARSDRTEAARGRRRRRCQRPVADSFECGCTARWHRGPLPAA